MAKDGTQGGWVTLQGSVKQVFLAGDRIGALMTGGTLLAKDGMCGGWVILTGNVASGLFQ